MSNKTHLLRDPNVDPTEAAIKNALGPTVFEVFKELTKILYKYKLVPEWRFYRDGNAWLCKVVYKKKTIFWLSIWENLIKVSFYFTERTVLGLKELAIKNEFVDNAFTAKPIGKLIPLVFEVDKIGQLPDLEAIINYKKSLK
jgi:hypothetical protein